MAGLERAPPWNPRPPRSGSGRKRGGESGHPGQSRCQVPEADLTARHEYFPEACNHCGAGFADAAALTRRPPQRHQVWELPAAPPEVTEHRWYGCTCPECGRVTWAALPPGVPRGGQGSCLKACLGLLTGAYRVSRRHPAQLVHEGSGIPLCAATVSRVETRLTGALVSVHAALGRALVGATQVHVDGDDRPGALLPDRRGTEPECVEPAVGGLAGSGGG